jgi:1,4-alpha-glucan branching enzyme
MQMKTQSIKDLSLTKVYRMTPFAFQAPTAQQVSLAGDFNNEVELKAVISGREAGQVSLAGDFNNWDPKAGPMHKGHDGMWHLSVALKPGRYEYRFFVDKVWCDDPAALQKAANSLGTENCVRIV